MNANTEQNSESTYYITQNSERFVLNIKIQTDIIIISVKKENNFSLKYSIKLELKDMIKKINYLGCMIQYMNLMIQLKYWLIRN